MKKNFSFIVFIFSFFVVLCVLSTFPLKDVSAEEDLYTKFRVVKSKTEKPAPLFTLKDLEGKEISIEDFRGKVVLLHFWATWCKPCVKEMPTMEKFYNTFKDKGLDILAVSIDRRNVKGVESFVNKFRMTFPVLLDPDQKVRKKYFVNGLPTSYLIDAEGKLKGFLSGARDWASDDSISLIENFIQKDNS